MALNHFLRVHSLVPRDFETCCRFSLLACLLFTSSIFSRINTIFCPVFLLYVPIPLSCIVSQMVWKKKMRKQERSIDKLMGDQDYVCTPGFLLFEYSYAAHT